MQATSQQNYILKVDEIILNFPAGTAINKDEILEVQCDVLVPAAVGGVITEENASRLKCKFVVEAANGPTTPEGDAILRERGIVVLPVSSTAYQTLDIVFMP